MPTWLGQCYVLDFVELFSCSGFVEVKIFVLVATKSQRAMPEEGAHAGHDLLDFPITPLEGCTDSR